MPGRASNDKSYRHRVDFFDPFPSASAAICAVEFRLFNLRAPETASLQKIATRAYMPVGEAISWQKPRPFGLAEPLLTHRRQSEAPNLKTRLEWLVIDTLII